MIENEIMTIGQIITGSRRAVEVWAGFGSAV